MAGAKLDHFEPWKPLMSMCPFLILYPELFLTWRHCTNNPFLLSLWFKAKKKKKKNTLKTLSSSMCSFPQALTFVFFV